MNKIYYTVVFDKDSLTKEIVVKTYEVEERDKKGFYKGTSKLLGELGKLIVKSGQLELCIKSITRQD